MYRLHILKSKSQSENDILLGILNKYNNNIYTYYLVDIYA